MSKATVNKATVSSIIINDGLSYIESQTNPYSIARNLISIILAYRTYNHNYYELKAGFPIPPDHNRTEMLYESAKCKDYDCINHYLSIPTLLFEYQRIDRVNIILCGAAEGGDLDFVRRIEALYAQNWDGAMEAAAKGNHRHIIDYCIDKGSHYWTSGLLGAIKGNHIHLVEFFLNKGAFCIHDGIDIAAMYGYKDIIEYIVKFSMGKSRQPIKWDKIMYKATKHNHKDIVEICVKNGASDWKSSIKIAIEQGHQNLVDYFISKGFNSKNKWREELILAVQHNHSHLVRYFINKGAVLPEYLVPMVIKNNNFYLVKLFTQKPVSYMNSYMNVAASAGHLNLVKYFISKGASYLIGAIKEASNNGHRHIVDYLHRLHYV